MKHQNEDNQSDFHQLVKGVVVGIAVMYMADKEKRNKLYEFATSALNFTKEYFFDASEAVSQKAQQTVKDIGQSVEDITHTGVEQINEFVDNTDKKMPQNKKK